MYRLSCFYCIVKRKKNYDILKKCFDIVIEFIFNRLSEIVGMRLMFNNFGIMDLSDEFWFLKLNDMFCEMYDDKWMDVMEDFSFGGI